MIRKIIDKVTDIGLMAMLAIMFFSGVGLYFWNYMKSPEVTQAVSAFNELRLNNPDAARQQFHAAMSTCVQDIMGENITGRYKDYFADMFFILSDPAVSANISNGLEEIGKVEQSYRDILISQSMIATPEERVFERVQAKMMASRGNMDFYNCLLNYRVDAKQLADAAGSSRNTLPDTDQFADWRLLPTTEK